MAKILLIDDSEAVLQWVERVLHSAGHEVWASPCGATAVMLLEHEDFDLVLTDLYMPPPDGFEIIQAARELRRSVPLVVMSTNPLACDVFGAARALGAVAALQKPFTPELLLMAVERAVAAATARPGRTFSPQS